MKDAASNLRLADSLISAADRLHDAAGKLRAQAAKSSVSTARLLNALANGSDLAARLLQDRAELLIEQASSPCIPEGGGRF